jgi:hypothetical protein
MASMALMVKPISEINAALFPRAKKEMKVQLKPMSTAFIKRYSHPDVDLTGLRTLNMPGSGAEYGQCGAHVLRVLKWNATKKVISSADARNEVVEAFAQYSVRGPLYQELLELYTDLVTRKPDRWLDNIEITAAVVQQQYSGINLCVITENTQGKLKQFRGELLHFSKDNTFWVFLQMTQGFAHYEIVTSLRPSNKVQLYFHCGDPLTQHLLDKLEVSPQSCLVDSVVEQVELYANTEGGIPALVQSLEQDAGGESSDDADDADDDADADYTTPGRKGISDAERRLNTYLRLVKLAFSLSSVNHVDNRVNTEPELLSVLENLLAEGSKLRSMQPRATDEELKVYIKDMASRALTRDSYVVKRWLDEEAPSKIRLKRVQFMTRFFNVYVDGEWNPLFPQPTEDDQQKKSKKRARSS